ncbi:formimidoylglutamase [Moraxella nasovis]|uniref:formimidoylglutamase n=1 Tax=Moraxella nasovis TaxID=2904121 RepID=UPI001F6132F3|nr:formimidoylglutamase [Moraxella nasovis]UNU73120.1 formimidoylglutamase [Moraxella nasovis]
MAHTQHTPFNPKYYTGRTDPHETGRAIYWHNVVHAYEREPICLVGFACHQGVRRNLGRVGAKSAPSIIREFFAKLPITSDIQDTSYELQNLVGDMGDIVCHDDDKITPNSLEQAQHAYANQITQVLSNNALAVGLGGGHEIAYGSFLGLYQHLQHQKRNQKIGIINFDAHFDLRTDEYATSGTPFLQIADVLGDDFCYFCVGISRFANTASLFDKAKQLGVGMIFDDDCHRLSYDEIWQKMTDFINVIDVLYITVDLDSLPASVMPAVSAVNAKGIALDLVEFLLTKLIDTGKVRVLDFAEFNPNYDIDDRGAKVVARLLAVCVERYLLLKGQDNE